MQTPIWSVADYLSVFIMCLLPNANLLQNWKAYVHSLLKTETWAEKRQNGKHNLFSYPIREKEVASFP